MTTVPVGRRYDHGAGDQPGAARRHGRRRSGAGVRRGRRPARRRVPGDRGAGRDIRRRKMFRHAAGGVRDHRHRDRDGDPRVRAGAGDPVRRLRRPRVRPDRQPPGQVPDAHAWRRRHAGHHPHSVVRRNRCGRTSFGVHRDLLAAHGRVEGGRAVDAVGCVLVAALRHRRSGSGDLPRAQAPVLGTRSWSTPRFPASPSAGPRSAGRATTSR